MLVTEKLLKEKKVCKEGLVYIRKNYPEGATIIELCEDKNIPRNFLYWGVENLDYTDEEYKAYLRAVNVDEKSEIVWKSAVVSNSTAVSESVGVWNSQGVFKSENVEDSKNVFLSQEVNHGTNVKDSFCVSYSENVLASKNVTNSLQVFDSTYIQQSSTIYNSSQVVNSDVIYHSTDVQDSSFCAHCKNLRNAMFCYELDGGFVQDKFFLFNKEVSKMVYDAVAAQYERFVKYLSIKFLDFGAKLDAGEVAISIPNVKVDYNYYTHFKVVDDRFWNWVRTLPNYDADLLYKIVYVPKILIEEE